MPGTCEPPHSTHDKLTGQQLHPGAHVIDGGGVTEEEQQHGTNGKECRDDGQTDEDGGRLEGDAGYAEEVVQPSLALFTRFVGVARGPQPEFAWRVATHIPNPFRRDERHHTYDRVTYREYRPQHTYRLRIADVAGRVDLRRVHVFDLRAHNLASISLMMLLMLLLLFTLLLLLRWTVSCENGRLHCRRHCECGRSAPTHLSRSYSHFYLLPPQLLTCCRPDSKVGGARGALYLFPFDVIQHNLPINIAFFYRKWSMSEFICKALRSNLGDRVRFTQHLKIK